jgi:tight adherence protein B
MSTLLAAIAGPVVVAALIRSGQRAAAADHARGLTPSVRWRLPAPARAALARALAAADISTEPERVVEMWLIGVLAGALLASTFAPVMIIPALVVGVVSGPVALRMLRTRRELRFASALPAALEQLAAELRGGRTVAGAVERLGMGESPVASDFRRVHARAQLGLALDDALATWPTEHDTPGVRAVAGALAVAANLGGRAAEALDGLAASLRHRLDAVAESRSLSAQARLSAIVVGTAPLGYLVFSSLVDTRSVTVLLTTDVGRICLGLGLGLEALAAVVIRRIVAAEV